MFFPIPISGISSGQADSAAAHGAPWFGHSLDSSLSPGQVTKIQTQIKFPLNSFRTWQEPLECHILPMVKQLECVYLF